MKTLFATLGLLFLATAAQAQPPCNPATGNWVNAAPTTCPIATFSGQGSAAPEPKKPDDEDDWEDVKKS